MIHVSSESTVCSDLIFPEPRRCTRAGSGCKRCAHGRSAWRATTWSPMRTRRSCSRPCWWRRRTRCRRERACTSPYLPLGGTSPLLNFPQAAPPSPSLPLGGTSSLAFPSSVLAAGVSRWVCRQRAGPSCRVGLSCGRPDGRFDARSRFVSHTIQRVVVVVFTFGMQT